MEAHENARTVSNTSSIIGLVVLAIPVWIWGLWIWLFSATAGSSQEERVKLYLSYFPPFLTVTAISWIVIVTSVCAIVFSMLGRRTADALFRALGIFVIIAASCLLFLQQFTML